MLVVGSRVGIVVGVPVGQSLGQRREADAVSQVVAGWLGTLRVLVPVVLARRVGMTRLGVVVRSVMPFEGDVQAPTQSGALGHDPAEQDQKGPPAMISVPHPLFIPDRVVWRQDKPSGSLENLGVGYTVTPMKTTSHPPPSARDAAAVRFPPPFVFLLGIAAGLGLHYLLPLPLPILPGPWKRALVLAPALVGLGLLVSSLLHFFRTKQDPEPWKPTPELIAVGIYRWTRNPMYLGMAFLQVAAGVWTSSLWVLLALPLALLGVYFLAIRHEEAYLERKFGDAYRDYRAAVPRWLGFGRRVS